MKKIFSSITILLFFISCNETNNKNNQTKSLTEKQDAAEALLLGDSSILQIPILIERINKTKAVLAQKIPIVLLDSLNNDAQIAQQIAITNTKFCENLFDKKTHQAFRNEIFNVYVARPQEINPNLQNQLIYNVEMYNYALNLTTTA